MPRLSHTSSTLLYAGIAIALAAANACSSEADGLFNDSAGSSQSAGAGGAGGRGGAGGDNDSTTTGSSMTTGSSTTASGAGGAGGAVGAGGAGGAPPPLCGDGICNGTETPDTCLKDCPSTCGDGKCDGAENSQTCPKDCGAGMCAHPICETGDPLMDGCDPCVTTVCAADDACCNQGWDGQCVGEADMLCNAGCCGDGACNGEDCNSCPQDCGTCPPPPTCPHSVCAAGDALTTQDCRDPCVEETCAADASCCNGSPPNWTGECVDLGKMTCNANPCISAVCAQDPSCCSVGWTQSCAQLAVSSPECATGCDCAHSICSGQGGPLDPTCDPCASAVCAADPYCCDNNWDGYCVGEVGSICGTICN